MPTYLLHLRGHFTPWGMPPLPEVLCSIRSNFSDDPGLSVIPGRNAELGTYRLNLAVDSTAVCHSWSRGRNINFPWRELSLLLPLRAYRTDSCPRVPFSQCTIIPRARGKKCQTNPCLEKIGKLTKPTEHQKFKGQNMFLFRIWTFPALPIWSGSGLKGSLIFVPGAPNGMFALALKGRFFCREIIS